MIDNCHAIVKGRTTMCVYQFHHSSYACLQKWRQAGNSPSFSPNSRVGKM